MVTGGVPVQRKPHSDTLHQYKIKESTQSAYKDTKQKKKEKKSGTQKSFRCRKANRRSSECTAGYKNTRSNV